MKAESLQIDGCDVTKDYWKLMDDGSIVWDGSNDLTDERDNIIRKYEGEGGRTAALADHLGISIDEARQLIVSTGIESYVNGTFVDADGNDVTLDNNYAIKMDNSFMRNGSEIKYGELYSSRVITDSTTGMTGTIFDHNPVNIYNSLVESGRMTVNPLYDSVLKALGPEIANATFDSPFISYEDYKASNFIQGRPDVSVDDAYSNYLVSGAYGARSSDGKLIHKGVDWATPSGTPLYPMIYNDESTVSNIGTDLQSKQGNFITVKTPLNYSYKGQTINESLFSRYLHLDSFSVEDEQGIFQGLYMGTTGNTGKWDGKAYDSHLHFDMYTKRQSPYMNFLSMQNGGQAYMNDFRYNPFLLLNQDKYQFDPDAHLYDF